MEDRNSPSVLDVIPTDVVIEIFKAMKLREIRSCRMVCSRFRDLIDIHVAIFRIRSSDIDDLDPSRILPHVGFEGSFILIPSSIPPGKKTVKLKLINDKWSII